MTNRKFFGKRGAINSTSPAFERRKSWATKTPEERAATDAWDGVDRRRRDVEYRPAEADQTTRKIHFEGLVTYAVIAACLTFAVWQVATIGADGFGYVMSNLAVAMGG